MKFYSLAIPPRQEFDDTVHKILNGPEYSHLKNGLNDFISRIKENLRQWLEKILNNVYSDLSQSMAVSEKLSIIFMIIGILVILSIIILIIVRLSKTLQRKGRITEILGEKIDEKTTPFSLREKAVNFERISDYRQAIRYDFIGLLLLMHERNLVYLDETKTNEEIYNYLRRKNFHEFNRMKRLIDIFNASWYGHKECNAEIYKEWKDIINTLWGEVTGYEEKSK